VQCFRLLRCRLCCRATLVITSIRRLQIASNQSGQRLLLTAASMAAQRPTVYDLHAARSDVWSTRVYAAWIGPCQSLDGLVSAQAFVTEFHAGLVCRAKVTGTANGRPHCDAREEDDQGLEANPRTPLPLVLSNIIHFNNPS